MTINANLRGYYKGRIRLAVFLKHNKGSRRPVHDRTYRQECGHGE